MNYDIKPVETYYHGQHFKSILEARWACFFDICEWKWAYEPYKVGNKIPDFILQGINFNIIAEVKPAIFVTDEFIQSIQSNYKNQKTHVLILTDNPFTLDEATNLIICKGFDEWNHSDYIDFFMKNKNDFSSFIYNTERKTNPSFLRGLDVSDKR